MSIPDNRKEVKDTDRHPYDCVGLVVSYFEGEESKPVFGSGFLIGKRQVLTVCHNVYKKARQNKPTAKIVEFYPKVNG